MRFFGGWCVEEQARHFVGWSGLNFLTAAKVQCVAALLTKTDNRRDGHGGAAWTQEREDVSRQGGRGEIFPARVVTGMQEGEGPALRLWWLISMVTWWLSVRLTTVRCIWKVTRRARWRSFRHDFARGCLVLKRCPRSLCPCDLHDRGVVVAVVVEDERWGKM